MPSLSSSLNINSPFSEKEWIPNTKSLDFDGTGDYLSCGDIGDRLDSATALCIKAWIKIDNTDSEQIILYKGDSNDHIVLKIDTSGKLVFSTTVGGDTSTATSGNTINTGWEHVSINWNGGTDPSSGTNNATRLYMSINGGSSETVVFTGEDFPNTFSGLMNELCIWGHHLDIDPHTSFSCRAYLADSEDRFIRNLRIPAINGYTMPADIKLWLRFGDGAGDLVAGTLIYDQSVGGFNGIVSGNPSLTSNVPGGTD